MSENPAIAVGDEMPARTIEITREDVRRYADASGDHNPIHLDEDAATALGLPGLVAHGMLTMALSVGAVAEWAGGADRIRGTSFRFSAPVVVPADEPAVLEVSAKARKESADGSGIDIALVATAAGSKVFGKAVVTVSV